MNQEQLDAFLLEVRAVYEKHGLFFRVHGYEYDLEILDHEGNALDTDEIDLLHCTAKLHVPEPERFGPPPPPGMADRLTEVMRKDYEQLIKTRLESQSKWQKHARFVFGDGKSVSEEGEDI